MINLFFRLLCWIDDKVNHPLTDNLADGNKIGEIGFKFCQYAWAGRRDLNVKNKQDKLNK